MIEKNKTQQSAISNDVPNENATRKQEEYFNSVLPFLSYLEKRINKPVFLHCLDVTNTLDNGYYNYAFSNETKKFGFEDGDLHEPIVLINNAINGGQVLKNVCNIFQTVISNNCSHEGCLHLYVVRRGGHFPNAADDR